MLTPGYYKINYRALRFRELIRLRGFWRAFSGYLTSRFMNPRGGSWLPGLWADTACQREDLSEQFWRVAGPHHLGFARLGYTVCGFLKLSKNLNPVTSDTGGIMYLDATHRNFGQLLYTQHRQPTTGADVHKITIAFTATFAQGSLAFTNAKKTFDTLPAMNVIRVDSCDVNSIHQLFLDALKRRKETPREFPDLESLRHWYDARQTAVFEEHVRRRLFIPMTDQEIAAAKAGLVPADAKPFPALWQKLLARFWPVILVAILLS